MEKVRLSVMPKGVEHITGTVRVGIRPTVRLSVMPKGVEHNLNSIIDVTAQIGATFSDAERR